MTQKPLDPAGHLTLAVSDFSESRRFYKDLFAMLGYNQIRESGHSAAWATKEGFGIWIRSAERKRPRYTYFAPGLQHLCLKARTKKIVDEIHTHISTHGAPVFVEPKPYPEYTPRYYAVFFADPDGIKIEVACY